MFCKVITNTELVNTESLLLKIYRIKFFQVSGHKIFINKSIYNLVCVFLFEVTLFNIYSSPPLSTGDTFQDPQWMPETANSTEPYIYHMFSYTYMPTIKFNL